MNNNIARKTKELIGYDNYLKEGDRIKKRNKCIISVFLGIFAFCTFIVSVNALTDNAITDFVKLTFNGDSVDVNCEEYYEGISCTFDATSIGGSEEETIIIYGEDDVDNLQVEYHSIDED